MTKPTICTGALILAMTTVAVFQYEVNAGRREENRLLRQRIEEANAPGAVNQQPIELQPTDVASSDDRSSELVRLRSKIESLKIELTDLVKTTEMDRTALAQAVARQTANETACKETIRTTRNGLSDWGDAWTTYASQNHGQFPISFDQALPFLPGGVTKENELVPSQFDINYQGSLSNLENPNQIVALRQREAIQSPGGANWFRAYLFADGHCEIQSAPDGNFDAWESQHEAANK